MFRVALTGNIASGKSAVAEVWQQLGAHVVDADVLARRAVEPGSGALRHIEQEFGSGVISEGRLDRAALRSVVFDNESRRRALEAIIHPEVERLRRQEEQAAARAGHRIVVHVIPLLFEVGLEGEFDAVVLVDADAETRQERIVRTRGLSADEAEQMIRAQMPAADKRRRADYVIENDAGLQELREEAERVWTEIRARAT